jgi:DNA repair ATPase RecN
MEDGVKMTPLDDEFISEEARQTALDVRDNIAKLIRIFCDKEENMKLAAFSTGVRPTEFPAFMESFKDMQKLYNTKLNTPQEEVKSIKANLSLLKEKIQKLESLRTTKKDAYDKYCEECSKSKEIRDS